MCDGYMCTADVAEPKLGSHGQGAPPLLEQLKLGGRLVAPIGSRWEGRDLLVVERRPDGETSTQLVIPVAFVPLVRCAEE